MLSRHLRRNCVLTVSEYEECLRRAFSEDDKIPTVIRLEYLFDVTALYKEHINPFLKHFQLPHMFKFQKNEHGRVATRYKMWCTSPNWYPRQGLGGGTAQQTAPRLLSQLHTLGNQRTRGERSAGIPPTEDQLEGLRVERQFHDLVVGLYAQADATQTLDDDPAVHCFVTAQPVPDQHIGELCWLNTYPELDPAVYSTRGGGDDADPAAESSKVLEFRRFSDSFLRIIQNNQFCTMTEVQKQEWLEYLSDLPEKRAEAARRCERWTLHTLLAAIAAALPATAETADPPMEAFLARLEHNEEELIPYSAETTHLGPTARCSPEDLHAESIVCYKYTCDDDPDAYAALGQVQSVHDGIITLTWLRPISGAVPQCAWGLATTAAGGPYLQDVDVQAIMMWGIQVTELGTYHIHSTAQSFVYHLSRTNRGRLETHTT